MYYCKTRYYVLQWGRWLNADNTKYLDLKQFNKSNLYAYCFNNPINVCDDNSNLPTWAKWAIGGYLIVASITISIATAGLGSAFGIALGGSLIADIAGGAIAGALMGTITSAITSMGVQIIKNDIDGIDWKEVGRSALIGGISGAIAGGIFGGVNHFYSHKKNAESVAKLNSAKDRLNKAFNALKNIKDFVGKPFENSNIVNEMAKCIVNLDKAYINYIATKATYDIVIFASKLGFLVAENIVSNEIAKWFE